LPKRQRGRGRMLVGGGGRFSPGDLHSWESIAQHRVEDVDRLSISVIDAGKLAPCTLQRRGLRGVKLAISDAQRASGPRSAESARLLIYLDRMVDLAQAV